jgi:hypothetical protein
VDWLWPIYKEHIFRLLNLAKDAEPDQSVLQHRFMKSLAASTATLYIMEPVGDTIRFKGMGRWPLTEASDLLADPHSFIAAGFGGGKYKVNFHDGYTFVGTHNFRTYGDELWRDMDEVLFE